MASIQINSTSTIQATNHDNNSTPKIIELNPWDLKLLKIQQIQQGFLFQKPKTNQIQHLKQSLSTTLNFFPPLVDRLVISQQDDQHNNASCSIVCNNDGALFVHATAENTTIADILEPKYVPPFVQSFYPLNGVTNHEGTSQPLLAVQLTELVDGIFIAIDINHVVVDGKSFLDFVNSWAEISNGSNKLTKNPSLQRWFPNNNIDLPIRFPFTKEPKYQQGEDSPHRIFHFTKEQILQLKTKANAEISNNTCTTTNSDKIVISSLQALLTHIWFLIISKQHLDPEEDTICVLPIDCRTRVRPKLEETYFGNGLGSFAIIGLKVGKLLESGIGKVAMEMNKAISMQIQHEKIMSDYESWLKTPFIYEAEEISGNVLVVVSSPRLDFYGNDFGWGKPIAVRMGAGVQNNTGKIIVLGGAEEGSVDLELCLPYHVLEAIANELDALNA